MTKIKSLLMFLFLTTSFAFSQLQLNGAGATFPYVIYSKWFDVYNKKTNIQFNYQSIGSGGGIKQVIEGTVDFGATDGPMTDAQIKEAKEKQQSDVLHIPTVMGAVVVAFKLDGVKELKLSGETVAKIFLGEIKNWNDKTIANENKGIKLPNKPIVVVHRSDGSGTTFIFVDYLSKVSNEWSKKVGKATSVNWPIGLGAKGNEGVAGQIKQLEGSIGYVELAYAQKNNLPFASIKNKSGNYIVPSLQSVTDAAMNEADNIADDLRASITNADGKTSYPISGFTYLLIYKNQKDKEKGLALVNFLKWAMSDGQKFANELYYSPLPKEVVKKCEKKISGITF